MEPLKPCPFCGNQVKMNYYKEASANFMQRGYICCDPCNISLFDWSDIRVSTRHDTDREEKAIKSWNNRNP